MSVPPPTSNPSPRESLGQKPLALTMGEPAGIGGEIALKAWHARRAGTGNLPFFLIDDPARLASLARHLGLSVPIAEITAPRQAVDRFAEALPVLPLDRKSTRLNSSH